MHGQGAFHLDHPNLHKLSTAEETESFIQKLACTGWSAEQFYLFLQAHCFIKTLGENDVKSKGYLRFKLFKFQRTEDNF